jgi:dihydrofolate reductase
LIIVGLTHRWLPFPLLSLSGGHRCVSVAQQLLDAGLVDELHVDIMPVFLGIGLGSFESSSFERVRLEKISVQEVGARTSRRFRVKQ